MHSDLKLTLIRSKSKTNFSCHSLSTPIFQCHPSFTCHCLHLPSAGDLLPCSEPRVVLQSDDPSVAGGPCQSQPAQYSHSWELALLGQPSSCSSNKGALVPERGTPYRWHYCHHHRTPRGPSHIWLRLSLHLVIELSAMVCLYQTLRTIQTLHAIMWHDRVKIHYHVYK